MTRTREMRHQDQAEWSFKSKLFIGQIESVNEEKGTIDVVVGATHDLIKSTIPMTALSIKGVFSSWARSMPNQGDFVVCGYGPRNELEVVSYTAWGASTSDDSTSFSGNTAQRVRAEGYATLARKAGSDEDSLRIFRKLRSGEHDMRSSGGAGYWMSKEGYFLLEAGVNTIALDKQNDEVRGRSDMWVMGGDGVEVRFGDVKRKILPTDIRESEVTPNVASAPATKELRINVGYVLPPGIDFTLASFAAGDVRDGTGLPLVNENTGLPDRFLAKFYDIAGATALASWEVDVLGNTRLATKTTFTIATDLPASIHFGSFLSFEPYMKGATWATAAIAQNTAISASYGTDAGLHTSNAVQYSAIGAAMTTLGGVLLAGPPTAPTSVEALNALLGAFFTAQGTIFTAQGPGYYAPLAVSAGARVAANSAFTALAVPGAILSLKIMGE